MNRKLIFALAALSCAVDTAYAEPQPNVLPMPMLGSDTLHEVTLQVIQTCALQTFLDYQGTGSGNGGSAMIAKNQQIAPQSRFLSDAECNAFGTNPSLGQSITIGLDGIGLFGDATESNGCDAMRYSGSLTVNERNGVSGLQCPNCNGNSYTFVDWRDVLRIIYTGESAHIANSACSDADPAKVPAALGGTVPSGCGNGTVSAPEQCDDGNTANFDGCSSNCTWEIADPNRCNSDLRRELVENYGALFQNGCNDPECAALRHAFRRDDSSGTTDTFLSLLGLPAATARVFCNGFDTEDLDPIRRVCDDKEQVCNNGLYANREANPNGGNPTGPGISKQGATVGGDLGLLLPITMPADLDCQYGDPCTFGKFGYAKMPFIALVNAQRCPEGNPRTFGLCLWPTKGDGTFNCLASKSTHPGIRELTNMDGRAYNLVPRKANTSELCMVRSGLNDRRYNGGGFYRIHQTTAMPNAVAGLFCNFGDATQQIGCLVTASPCSIGYAGREGLDAGTNKAFRLRSPLNDIGFPAQEIGLEDVLIRRLMDPSGIAKGTCGNGNGDNFGYRYPLSRRLWIAASKGFGLPDFTSITNDVDSTDADTLPDLPSHEQDMLECMANRALTDGAIVSNGFVTLTDRNCSSGACAQDELDVGYRARSCSPRCGDGIKQPNEACDDGNLDTDDNCSATCTVQ